MLYATINDVDLKFETTNQLFSPRNVDNGTLAMLSVIDFKRMDKVCDLGCGYGVIGILAAKLIGSENVTMIDNSEEAIAAAKQNIALNDLADIDVILSDGFSDFQVTDFTKIICHPPYHVDFAVPKAFIEKGFNRLKIGGALYMVTKRKDWYKNKLTSIFGGVKIWEIDGYYVFMAIKKSDSYANVKQKKVKIKTPPKEKKRRKY
ncbi:methyltransferase [Listeria welshimeri]|nr:methyltransferase [Listeria welshimeri]MBC1967968.1 methyltransferase [Listeria welshimeri]MBC2301986.1 methyltransferase [Listeria welshimeri]